jgi:hypothetical protein
VLSPSYLTSRVAHVSLYALLLALSASSTPFPGPLFLDRKGGAAGEKAKKANILSYLDTRAGEIEQGLGWLKGQSNVTKFRQEEGKGVLVRLLSVMIQNDGRLMGRCARSVHSILSALPSHRRLLTVVLVALSCFRQCESRGGYPRRPSSRSSSSFLSESIAHHSRSTPFDFHLPNLKPFPFRLDFPSTHHRFRLSPNIDAEVGRSRQLDSPSAARGEEASGSIGDGGEALGACYGRKQLHRQADVGRGCQGVCGERARRRRRSR